MENRRSIIRDLVVDGKVDDGFKLRYFRDPTLARLY